MINLGLARITQILRALGNPHNRYPAIHVAGTNGKGSICSYISTAFTESKIRTGKYTSPALVTPRDCICIDNKPVSEDLFQSTKQQVTLVSQKLRVEASEFEILTATAFQVFATQKVEVGVIEVGLGGLHDATNVLQNVLVSVLAKIALDHQLFLGNTLEEIATHKAGILKKNTPCVVDGCNSPSVLKAVLLEARRKNCAVKIAGPSVLKPPLNGEYQKYNLGVALEALLIAKKAFSQLDIPSCLKAKWPGRLQELSFKSATGTEHEILLDGAHNTCAAVELGKYLSQYPDITFIVAMTDTKDVEGVFGALSKEIPGVSRRFIATQFGEVQGMPWVKLCDAELLASVLAKSGETVSVEKNLLKVLGSLDTYKGKVVVCGSLYLVGEVLRHHLANGGDESFY